MKKKASYSVVIPVYKSEKSLGILIRELKDFLPQISSQYELILVNDASPDASWSVIQKWAKNHPWIKGVNLKRNCGQHQATLGGLRLAQYDNVITLDDDLQHPVSQIPQLIKKFNQGFDLVYGMAKGQQHSFCRDFCSKTIKLVLKFLTRIDLFDQVTGFRIFKRKISRSFINYQGFFLSLDVLLNQKAVKTARVLVSFSQRKFGTSNYTLRKLIIYVLSVIMSKYFSKSDD